MRSVSFLIPIIILAMLSTTTVGQLSTAGENDCLNCHGDPKGELDITGGKKEGGQLGELGGAISVVIYD